jgi:chloride channel protein, CIC family
VPPARRALVVLLALALAIGVVDGLVFLGFEWAIKHGTDWVWNDVVDTDSSRWRVVPLALVLSIAFSALLRLIGQPRWTAPHLDPLGPTEAPGAEPAPPPALTALGTILLVGAGSLIAGASLGPEAPLVALATGLGAWAAARADVGAPGRLLILASVGALLVAFFGSLIPLAIPVLVLYQRTRSVSVPAVLVVVASGLAAWGTLWLAQGNDHGFGGVPELDVNARDYAAALVLGVVAAGVGIALRRCIEPMSRATQRIQARTSWWLAAALFGAVLGGLYLAGGETVQFSGSEGSAMLLSDPERYGTWALLGIAAIKLLATGWSLSAGYRGGLVFPSVFVGVAISVFVASAVPDLAGPGVLIGAIAGLLVEMTAPALGVILLLALLPAKLLPLGLVGALGAVAGRRLLSPRPPADRPPSDLRPPSAAR